MLKSLLIGACLATLAAGCASAPTPHAMTDTGARATHEAQLPPILPPVLVRSSVSPRGRWSLHSTTEDEDAFYRSLLVLVEIATLRCLV